MNLEKELQEATIPQRAPASLPTEEPGTPSPLFSGAASALRIPAFLRESPKEGSPVLVAGSGLSGLDRLLDGGMRLCLRGELSPAPAIALSIVGPAGSGRTSLAFQLASALCSAHGRGVALYLGAKERLSQVRQLLSIYGDSGFAWVSSEQARSSPTVATGVILLGCPDELNPQVIHEISTQLSRDLLVRAVVVDRDSVVSTEAMKELAQYLLLVGISLIVTGPQSVDTVPSDPFDLTLELATYDPSLGGRALRVAASRLGPVSSAPSLLLLGDGGLRVLPPPSLYPGFCKPPEPAKRSLPAGYFGDPTLDRRAGEKPWLTPQCRILLYGTDPTCTLLLVNRFLAEAPQRLAIFFTGPSSRYPGGEGQVGIGYVRRTQSGAEILAQVVDQITAFRARWPRQMPQVARVALIDPHGLFEDGRGESAPSVLDPALLSILGEAGVMSLICRTGRDLMPWWSDFDLVLQVPQRTQSGVLTVRVVSDRVSV